MYMPFPYCLLFGDIKQLTIEAVAIPIIGGDHKFFSYNNMCDWYPFFYFLLPAIFLPYLSNT